MGRDRLVFSKQILFTVIIINTNIIITNIIVIISTIIILVFRNPKPSAVQRATPSAAAKTQGIQFYQGEESEEDDGGGDDSGGCDGDGDGDGDGVHLPR